MKNKNIMQLRSRKGSLLAELSLIIPLLILLIGGVYEMSRIYYILNTLEYAAKEAARVGASVKEGTDESYMSKTTISRIQLENLIKNSVRVMGVIEEAEQFRIRYLNPAGNEVQGIQNDLPFDRQNNPGAVDYVEVEISYPGMGQNVSTPIPAVFNPGNILQEGITLMGKAVFQIEGRFER